MEACDNTYGWKSAFAAGVVFWQALDSGLVRSALQLLLPARLFMVLGLAYAMGRMVLKMGARRATESLRALWAPHLPDLPPPTAEQAPAQGVTMRRPRMVVNIPPTSEFAMPPAGGSPPGFSYYQ